MDGRSYDRGCSQICYRSSAMNTPERVISVVLSDAEWKAFLSLQPQPVAWLRVA